MFVKGTMCSSMSISFRLPDGVGWLGPHVKLWLTIYNDMTLFLARGKYDLHYGLGKIIG